MKKFKLMATLMAICILSTSFGGILIANAAPEGYFDVPLQNAGLEDDGKDDPLPGFMNETIYTPIDNIEYENYQYVSITTDNKHSGEKSLKLYDAERNGSTRALTNSIPVAAAEIYKAEFWAYVPAGFVGNAPSGTALNATQAKARFKAYHANGSEKAIGTAVLLTATDVVNNWVKYEIADYTVPAGLSYLKLEFYVDGTDYAVAYIDDIAVYKKGSAYTKTALTTARQYNKVNIENTDFEAAVNKEWSLDERTSGGETALNKFEIVSDKRFEGNNSLHYIDKDGASTGIITHVASKFYTALPGDVFRGSVRLSCYSYRYRSSYVCKNKLL